MREYFPCVSLMYGKNKFFGSGDIGVQGKYKET